MSKLKDEKILMLLKEYRDSYRLAPSVFVGRSVDVAELSLIEKQIDKSMVKALKELL